MGTHLKVSADNHQINSFPFLVLGLLLDPLIDLMEATMALYQKISNGSCEVGWSHGNKIWDFHSRLITYATLKCDARSHHCE
jgi:hypothetical protein